MDASRWLSEDVYKRQVQPARRGVAVEQDAQPQADDEDVAQHVQLLAVGQGAEVREEPLEQADKRREQDAGVDRLGTELPDVYKRQPPARGWCPADRPGR